MAAAFIAPAALVIVLVVLVPLARAAWMSLFDISLIQPGDEPFVGLGNYVDQLTSPDFWAAVWRSLFFTVVSTTLELLPRARASRCSWTSRSGAAGCCAPSSSCPGRCPRSSTP